MPIRFVPIFLLALPLLEIAGFVIVGRQIGVLATLGLVILSVIAGALLLRIQGAGVVGRIRRELDLGGSPGRDVAHGAMIAVAAILLMIPGFITDIVGLLLFVPAIRDVVWRHLKKNIVVVGSFSGRARPSAGGPTIDLDAADYSREPGRPSPWRRIEED
jgi:UPF0716 protein FxsA